MKIKKDRPWSKYPIGTKAHAFNGGHWIKTELGWKWCTGATFPTPGGDAIGECVELPDNQANQADPGKERLSKHGVPDSAINPLTGKVRF